MYAAKVLPPVAAAGVLLAAWWAFVTLSDVSPVLLPGPLAVAEAGVEAWSEILRHSGWTLLEALGGFVTATFLGVFGAIVFTLSPRLAAAFYPLVIALKMIPLIALAPLIVLWLGTGLVSKVAMAAIVAFFPILVNTLRGLSSVGQEQRELFQTLRASRTQTLLKLRLPSALGYMLAALRVSAVFAVIGAVVAEFIGASVGIGYFIKVASYYAATDRMIAGIIATGAVGIALYVPVLLIERMSPRWRYLATGDVPV